jgi:signal transduction histidine kinase/FixJ family two-component response regulator
MIVMGAMPRSTPVRSRSRERYVLCVDDDRDFLKSLEFFLPARINRPTEEPGLWYRFQFIDDPREALRVLEEIASEGDRVALLISDQMMPGMKGTAFLAEARGLSPESTRALLTGHAGIESAIVAINAGLLDRYLTKPISNEEDFAMNVRHLLEQYETRIELQDRNDLIERLYGFSNQLNDKEGLEETVETILEFARHALQCQMVHVVLAADNGQVSNGPDDGRPTFRPSHEPAGGPERTLGTGIQPWVGRANHVGEIRGLEAGPLARAPGPFAYGTLRDGNAVLGLIVASGPAGGAFVDSDLRNLGYLCDTAAIAIDNQLSRRQLVVAWSETRNQAAQLEAANRRLVILDKLRGDFLTFISHELRTPLSYFSAVNLLDVARSPEEIAKLMRIVRSGYERLERFITKGLDYFGWLGVERVVEAPATELTRLTGELLARRAAEFGAARIGLEGENEACWADIETDHAGEILGILLDNAVKFSAPDERIQIRFENVAGGARIIVTDQGRGFPKEWNSEICQPFTIVDSKHHREGTALSLAKITEMVRSYGGTLAAHSEGLGKGATFTVDLPRTKHPRGNQEPGHGVGNDRTGGPPDAPAIAA